MIENSCYDNQPEIRGEDVPGRNQELLPQMSNLRILAQNYNYLIILCCDLILIGSGADAATTTNMSTIYTKKIKDKQCCCCCLPCDYRSKWTWVDEWNRNGNQLELNACMLAPTPGKS